jgi:hypothetical protein
VCETGGDTHCGIKEGARLAAAGRERRSRLGTRYTQRHGQWHRHRRRYDDRHRHRHRQNMALGRRRPGLARGRSPPRRRQSASPARRRNHGGGPPFRRSAGGGGGRSRSGSTRADPDHSSDSGGEGSRGGYASLGRARTVRRRSRSRRGPAGTDIACRSANEVQRARTHAHGGRSNDDGVGRSAGRGSAGHWRRRRQCAPVDRGRGIPPWRRHPSFSRVPVCVCVCVCVCACLFMPPAWGGGPGRWSQRRGRQRKGVGWGEAGRGGRPRAYRRGTTPLHTHPHPHTHTLTSGTSGAIRTRVIPDLYASGAAIASQRTRTHSHTHARHACGGGTRPAGRGRSERRVRTHILVRTCARRLSSLRTPRPQPSHKHTHTGARTRVPARARASTWASLPPCAGRPTERWPAKHSERPHFVHDFSIFRARMARPEHLAPPEIVRVCAPQLHTRCAHSDCPLAARVCAHPFVCRSFTMRRRRASTRPGMASVRAWLTPCSACLTLRAARALLRCRLR